MATVTVQRRQRARKRKTTAEPAACGVTLPDHLVTEVLLRLPARSLARLRSTCRSWNAEISSSDFQERYHALAAAKFTFLKYADPHTHTLQLRRRGRPGGQWMARCADCPRVIGSKACCGLVLVGRRCTGYYLCNPTTGEILRLPRSHRLHCAIGFGFHAPSREFKVVQIIESLRQGQLQVTVLTVGDARGWRAPASASLVGFTGNAAIEIDMHVQPVLADGCLHWSFRAEYLDKPHGHGIISFSLANESFRLVPQPPFSTVDLVQCDGDEDQQHRSQLRRACCGMPVGKTLAELDGRLCMMRDLRHRSDVGSLLFEIWKLQDYDTRSWSLDYRVDLTPAGHMAERLKAPWLVVPLRYLDGGGSPSPPAEKRKLLLATTAHEAHIYDPGSGTLQTLASTAVGGDSGDEDDEELNSVRLVLYHESLVRFPGMKKGKGRIEFLQLEQPL